MLANLHKYIKRAFQWIDEGRLAITMFNWFLEYNTSFVSAADRSVIQGNARQNGHDKSFQ
jgi:hypothetical protein